MIFGAGKGVTTLGVWGRSTGLIRWWIRNKTSRNRTMPNPRRALRLTLGIRMRLWSLLLSLRYWGWGFGFSIRRERSSPPSVEDLIRLRALRRPLPVIFRLGFMDAETFPQWSSESSQMVSSEHCRERERERTGKFHWPPLRLFTNAMTSPGVSEMSLISLILCDNTYEHLQSSYPFFPQKLGQKLHLINPLQC